MNPMVPIDTPRSDPSDLADRLHRLKDDPVKLLKAAEQFEAMVLGELLRPLREHGGMLGNSMGSKFASDMFHDAILQRVAEGGGIGIKDVLLRNMGAVACNAYEQQSQQPAWPVPGHRAEGVGSGFGERIDPFSGATRMHNGIDVGAPQGTAVYPVLGGRVTYAGESGGYGNLVIVDHGQGVESRYAHLARVSVTEGDWLEGDVALGSVGSTGRSTAPHLHLEVRRNGEAVDPQGFLGGTR